MKSIARYTLLMLISIFTAAAAMSQDLSKELQRVGIKNVTNYAGPIFNGFTADLNSAFYHSADLHSSLGFDAGIKFGFSVVKDADRKYDFITPDVIYIKDPTNLTGPSITLRSGTDYDAVVHGAPTAVGDKKNEFYVKMIRSTGTTPEDNVKRGIYDSLRAQHGNDNLFQIPNGFDLGAIPLIMPQFAIGLPFGMEVMIRFIPTVSATDAGKFNYMGFGLRYDIDQWIPLCPVDVAVHFMTQKMNFKSKDDKDIFNATGTAYGIEASKRLLFLTVYGGLQLEQATVTLSKIEGTFTTPDGTNTPFEIPEMEFKGKNKSRATIGIRALLAVVNLHAEYSVAESPVLSAGIGISLR